MRRIIAVLAGGDSSERQVSLNSANTIMKGLDRELYEPYFVNINGLDWQVCLEDGTCVPVNKDIFGFISEGKTVKFDYAYIIIHGTPGENGILEGYLRLMHIPFSTCDVLASALTFNKFMLNQYLKSFGVRVADSILLRSGQSITSEEIVEKVGLPCFIKPNDGGSSFGTTKVKSKDQIESAIDAAFKEDSDVIIESFMDGMELTNGCYKTRKGWTVLPVTEVVPKREFFDYDAKYNGQVEEITPARISCELRDRVQKLTKAIYEVVGCKGIIRIDYIITEGEKINLLEVNTTPGMSPTSFIPQQLKAAGLELKEVLTEIIEDSF